VWRKVLENQQPSQRSIGARPYSEVCCRCDVKGCDEDCLCRALKTECVDCRAGHEVCDNQQIRRFLQDGSKAAQWVIKQANNPEIGLGMFVKVAVRPAGLVVVFRGSWTPRSEKPKTVSPCLVWLIHTYSLV